MHYLKSNKKVQAKITTDTFYTAHWTLKICENRIFFNKFLNCGGFCFLPVKPEIFTSDESLFIAKELREVYFEVI